MTPYVYVSRESARAARVWMAAKTKALIMALAIRGLVPSQLATWLLQRLRLRAA